MNRVPSAFAVSPSPFGRSLLRALAENWWLLFIRGAAAIIFGILTFIWPLATILSQSPDLAIGLVILTVVFPFVGVSLSWAALWIVIMMILLLIFTVGCALLLSCANLFYRDVKYIVQITLNFGVFATPVFFEPQMLGPKGAEFILALPLSPFIQAMDVAMVHGHNLLTSATVVTAKGPVVVWAPWMLGYAAGSAILLLTVGLLVFRRASTRFAEMA